MISLHKRFLFVHVPKTGGNAVQRVLRRYSEDEIVRRPAQDGLDRFGVRNARYNTVKHSTLSDYHRAIEPEIYGRLRKFATIRNPWDRLISRYFSPHAGVTAWHRDRFIALVESVRPVRFYVCLDPEGAGTLDRDLDLLMRFEHLADDFRRVCELIDVPYEAPPPANVSNRGDYAHYYDAELVALVRTKYRDEIEFGGYAFT